MTAVSDLTIRDANDINVTAQGNGVLNTTVFANGNIDFSGNDLTILSSVYLNSNIAGGNGDITIADTNSLEIYLLAGTGNVDASDTDNHAERWYIVTANDVTLFDTGDTTLGAVSATSMSVEAGNVDIN